VVGDYRLCPNLGQTKPRGQSLLNMTGLQCLAAHGEINPAKKKLTLSGIQNNTWFLNE